MKAVVGAFNKEKALVGAFSVIVKTDCETDGSFYTLQHYLKPVSVAGLTAAVMRLTLSWHQSPGLANGEMIARYQLGIPSHREQSTHCPLQHRHNPTLPHNWSL